MVDTVKRQQASSRKYIRLETESLVVGTNDAGNIQRFLILMVHLNRLTRARLVHACLFDCHVQQRRCGWLMDKQS